MKIYELVLVRNSVIRNQSIINSKNLLYLHVKTKGLIQLVDILLYSPAHNNVSMCLPLKQNNVRLLLNFVCPRIY